MKILFISPRFEGGIGGHAARLAQKLGDSGFEIDLFHVPHIPIKNLKNPSFAVFGVLKALQLKKKYDVVHGFNVPSALVMKYVKAKKKVISLHGLYSEQVDLIHSSVPSKATTLAESKAIEWADAVTTDSQSVQKTYEKKYGIKVDYLPAPIEFKKFNDIPDVNKVKNQVSYVGRDSYEKGIDVLQKIESRINGNVVYCTNVSWKEAMTVMKSSSLLVVPSRMESLPQVIKEAFVLKIPVVGTTAGGIPEIVKDNVSGKIVPTNNSEKLLEAINFLLDNPQEAEKMGNAGCDFVMKNFTWDVLLPKYVNFYNNLI